MYLTNKAASNSIFFIHFQTGLSRIFTTKTKKEKEIESALKKD